MSLILLVLLMIFMPVNAALIQTAGGEADLLESRLVVEDINVGELELVNLELSGNIDLKDSSLELISFDASNQASGSILSVQNSTLTFQPAPSASQLTIVSSSIQDKAIDANKIKDNELDSRDFADASISTDKIQDGSIGTDKIADASISSVKFIDSSVVTGQALAGFPAAVLGPINPSFSIGEAISSLASTINNNTNLVGTSVESVDPVFTGGLTVNGDTTITGSLDIKGTLRGAGLGGSANNADTVADLQKNIVGNDSNSVLYQSGNNATDLVDSTAGKVRTVMSMDSAANPVPSWKEVNIQAQLISTQTVGQDCDQRCADFSGTCIAAQRNGFTQSCKLRGSQFNLQLPNSSGSVACNCLTVEAK